MDPTYKAWSEMRQRCNNSNREDWKNYGGRGITYDPAWEVFSNFRKDMGRKPSRELSLDRIDNNGNYCKANCRWADRVTQNNNRRERELMTAPRPNNKSTGILGLSWEIRAGKSDRVVAYCNKGYKRTFLYRGNDFFEACCARKSYEALSRGGKFVEGVRDANSPPEGE